MPITIVPTANAAPTLKPLLLTLLAFGVSSHCGAGLSPIPLLSDAWSDKGGRKLEKVERHLTDLPHEDNVNIAVAAALHAGVTFGMPLETGAQWNYFHRLDTLPIASGSVVVGSGDGEVFAVDALSGLPLWVRPTGGLTLLDAVDGGGVTVVLLRSAHRTGSVLLAVQRDGRVVRQIETSRDIGTSAVWGGWAFVPWGGSHVSAIDLSNGTEAGRLSFSYDVRQVWEQGGALFFGGDHLVRWDIGQSRPSRRSVYVPKLAVLTLPPGPARSFRTTEYHSPLASDANSSFVVTRFATSGTPLRMEDSEYYEVEDTTIRAIDFSTQVERWAMNHQNRVLAAAAAPGMLVACDSTGVVLFLDARTGDLLTEESFEEDIDGCTVKVDALKMFDRH